VADRLDRRLVLVRHGRPEVTEGALPPAWPLSDASRQAISGLGRRLTVDRGAVLVSSTEPKALATAEALELGLEVIAADELREVAKPWFEDEADLHRAAAAYFGGEVLLGWEPLAAAVARFRRVIDQLDSQHDSVVVTHGMVMTAWLASIGVVADGYRFWLRLTQPDAWEVSLNDRRLWQVL
jgi:broad specificity phosphatase PhoE